MRIKLAFVLAGVISWNAVHPQTVEHPLGVKDVDSPPELVKQVDPKFPRSLFAKPKSGEVLVGTIVDEQGIPQRTHIERSMDKKFDDAAMTAVKQYRFKPAMKDGAAVAVQLNVAVNFQVF